MEKDLLKNNFAIYGKKAENEYWLKVNGQRVPTLSTITMPDEEDLFIRTDECTVFKAEFIERLNPDNIDSCKFWKMATKKFPLFSIAGGIQTITTIEQANDATLVMAQWLSALGPVGMVFEENKDAKILEIGPGHGGFYNHFNKCYGDKNYYAIDVNPLFEHPRLFKTNGRKIPSTIPFNLDVIYSMNVFQHLSKAQRTAYYKQSWMALKTGGIFVFGMFVLTEENKDKPLWGSRDENGRCYCSFFRQLTPIDTEDELLTELIDIGFEVEQLSDVNEQTNYFTYKCTKTECEV